MSKQRASFTHTGNDGETDGGDARLTDGGPATIKTERLTKRVRGVSALKNVSITVRSGEVYGLIGGQGAGKTTLAQLLIGFLHPDGGKVRLFESDDLARARARIGYLPEKARYHGNFTGRAYLRFHAELSGLKGREAQLVAGRVADTVGLGGATSKLIGGYSKAMRRRLGLAVALLSGGAEPPELLILDEPATGMDGELAATFQDVVLDCKGRGSTVFICSRELTQVERACTSVGILRAGRLMAQTHIDENPRAHIVGVARDGAVEIMPHLVEYLRRLHTSVIVRGGVEGKHIHVVLPAGSNVPHAVAMKAAALRAMIDARWDILSVYNENRDLESLFLQAVPPADVKKVTETPFTKSWAETAVVTGNTSAPSRDTGPLGDESSVIGEGGSVTLERSAATGPLPPIEVEAPPKPTRSPITGPLDLYRLERDVASRGNGVETAAERSGPSTAPLPALDASLGANGYESVMSPLPVRAVSGSRRGGSVGDEVDAGGRDGE